MMKHSVCSLEWTPSNGEIKLLFKLKCLCSPVTVGHFLMNRLWVFLPHIKTLH